MLLNPCSFITHLSLEPIYYYLTYLSVSMLMLEIEIHHKQKHLQSQIESNLDRNSAVPMALDESTPTLNVA